MLFHTFSSQEERRTFGGSAFVELQFCVLPIGTKEKKLVEPNSIHHWKNDSLYVYVEDLDTFYQEYNPVFDCDVYGVNYYAPATIDSIVVKLNTDKPTDYKQLVTWLNDARQYNGFYILGI